MLVLSRKKNESIIINDDITVVVVEVRGDKVRLGIEAPLEVPVYRHEVFEAIKPPGRHFSEAQQLQQPVLSPEPTPDGLACPQCQSTEVAVTRIKPAYRGKELVRWRKCSACEHEFHTIERMAML